MLVSALPLLALFIIPAISSNIALHHVMCKGVWVTESTETNSYTSQFPKMVHS